MNICITGSLAYDLIMDFPGTFLEHIDTTKLHILNISFLVDTLKKERGGNSANIAYTLSLLGVKSTILSSAGNDFGPYSEFLKEQDIDNSEIKIIDDDTTATAVIMTDRSDNQISAFYPGAMKSNINMSLKNLKTKPEFVIITPDLPEAMVKFALECKELQIPYLFDPGMQLPALSDTQLKTGTEGAEILIGNDYEMGVIKKRLFVAELDLLSKVRVLITTFGERGSKVLSKVGEYTVSAVKSNNVLDPTGAGDAYRAGFLAGYFKQMNLKTCAQLGSVASCYAVEKYGTTNHKFSVSEFKNKYKESFGEDIDGEI